MESARSVITTVQQGDFLASCPYLNSLIFALGEKPFQFVLSMASPLFTKILPYLWRAHSAHILSSNIQQMTRLLHALWLDSHSSRSLHELRLIACFRSFFNLQKKNLNLKSQRRMLPFPFRRWPSLGFCIWVPWVGWSHLRQYWMPRLTQLFIAQHSDTVGQVNFSGLPLTSSHRGQIRSCVMDTQSNTGGWEVLSPFTLDGKCQPIRMWRCAQNSGSTVNSLVATEDPHFLSTSWNWLLFASPLKVLLGTTNTPDSIRQCHACDLHQSPWWGPDFKQLKGKLIKFCSE